MIGARVSMTSPQCHRCEANVDGIVTHLSWMECVLVAHLLVSPPHKVLDYETIIEALWPDPDTQALTARNVLSVMLRHLRGKGIAIETHWGRGLCIPAAARGAPRAVRPYYMRMAA